MGRQTLAIAGICAALVIGHPAVAGPASDKAAEAEALMANGDAAAAHDAMRDAYRTLWETGPLLIRRAVLVDQPVARFGEAVPRADDSFAAGEPIRLYIEPVGFGWRTSGNGVVVEFQLDTEIASDDGTLIWGRENLQRFRSETETPSFEFFETLTYRFDGLSAGRYTIRTTLSDVASGKSATVETPITID